VKGLIAMNRPHVSETPHHKATEEKPAHSSETSASQPDLTSGQRTVLAAQQSVGNQAVIRRMLAQNAVQRAAAANDDLMNTPFGPFSIPGGGSAPAPASAGGGSISGTGGSVNVDGSGVEINSNGPISLNAPIVNASGAVHTPTLVADQVVSASYTPGAGNMW